MNWNVVVLLFATALSAQTPGSPLIRQDFFVLESAEVKIRVREVIAPNLPGEAPAILLIHGARVPGVASFDLDVPGGSLAADLAQRGLAVYVMDLLGYGGSTRPKEMDEPPTAKPALVRTNQAAQDIAVLVDWICSRRHVAKVALFGWATGGQWAGYYASVSPQKVEALILLNSLYGGSSVHL